MRAIYEAVGLQEVRLFQKTALLDLDSLTHDLANVRMDMESKAAAGMSSPSVISAIARFRTFSLDEGKALDVACSYRLVYLFDREEPPTDEEIAELCQGTVLFNAWPFWRQEVAATFAAAGIPFPVVPSLRPDLSLFQPGIGTNEDD